MGGKARISAQKGCFRIFESFLLMALNVTGRMKEAAVSLRRMLHHLLCDVCEKRLGERRQSTAVTAFLLSCWSTELPLCVYVDGFAESGFSQGQVKGKRTNSLLTGNTA